MDNFICMTCGTQFAESPAPPPVCPICTDERQYVLPTGQAWTTLARLRQSHMNAFRSEGELIGVSSTPQFAIGQRALLVPGSDGLMVWDCLSLVDAATVKIVNAIGRVKAMAISHPHYYSSMVEWSRAFGDVPVYLHAADRQWVMRPDPAIVFWDGEQKAISSDMTLIRGGGHFAGGTMMHWAAGAGGKGALLTGDILQVLTDRRHMAFMRSYPKLTPLGVKSVRALVSRTEDFKFDTIYGAFWDRVVPDNGKAAIRRSVARHVRWLEEKDGADI